MGLFYSTDPNQRFSDIKRKRESIEPIRQKWAKDRQFINSLDEFKSQNRSQTKRSFFRKNKKLFSFMFSGYSRQEIYEGSNSQHNCTCLVWHGEVKILTLKNHVSI